MKKIIAIVITGLLLSACAGQKQESNNPKPMEKSTSNQESPPAAGEEIALMTTNKGLVKIKLFPALAPNTVKNFVELSKKGFYNGLTFHRVIPNFMIQGGDPVGDGTGGETWNGKVLQDEFSDELTHIRGALSMANRGPNTGTSQFFIVHGANGATYLDGKHAIFGQVFEGIEVVDAIVNVKRNKADQPIDPVVIKKFEIGSLTR